MKNSTSFKMCLIALCVFMSANMSAGAEQAVKQAFTKSGITANVTNYNWSQLITTPKGLATTAFLLSLFIFFAREADHTPDRYDLEELKADPSFKNIFKFVYYFLLDGVIGHVRKPSSLKVDEDGKTIQARPGVPSRGFYGKISDIIKPLGQTLGFVLATGKFAKEGIDGLFAWEILTPQDNATTVPWDFTPLGV